MVFGFGFNKTKVLASAERYVKQGKLQNAVADYEKILAEDPKDLTVMNTVGDLYARIGNVEKATDFFRKIGDAYASEGFTVRAIAIYKKLTKQNPAALSAVLKLGELYTQQGLYNDARAQFMLVAEQHVRNNEFPQAAAVLQKTLELDPENTSLQTRLAGLYVKIGRPAEARDLYFRNAEALRTRGALDLADDALGRVLQIDPNFGPAMLVRGQVKFDSGDFEAAVHILEQVPDIDSRPEGLRALLKAQLALGNLAAAEPIARKLLQIFNDSSGIAGYGEALLASGAYEQALDLFTEHASTLLSAGQPAFTQALQALTGRVKSNPKALEQLAALFQRAGDTGCTVEVTELLAHAYVQQGELVKARDLYQQLTHLEPENPQHAQNFRQIISKLSESLPPRPPVEENVELETKVETPTETFSSEEIYPVSAIEQKYPGDVAELVKAAITDAELFDSYNLASKAIAPLEIVLPRVPSDVTVNQRLVSLYARAGRLREAAERCSVLEKVHAQAGFQKDSRFYAELGAKYRQRASLSSETELAAAAPQPQLPVPPVTTSEPTPAPQPGPPSFVPPVAPPESHEIDLSAEWEQMLEIEHPEPAPAQLTGPTAIVSQPSTFSTATPGSGWENDEAETLPLVELLDEVRFYVSQAMWPEARTALARCELVAPDNAEIAQLKAQLAAVEPIAHPTDASVGEFELISADEPHNAASGSAMDPLLMPAPGEVTAASLPDVPAPELVPVHSFLQDLRPAAPVPESASESVASPSPASLVEPPVPSVIAQPPADHDVDDKRHVHYEEPSAAEATAAVAPLDAFVHDLDLSLGDDFQIERQPPTPHRLPRRGLFQLNSLRHQRLRFRTPSFRRH